MLDKLVIIVWRGQVPGVSARCFFCVLIYPQKEMISSSMYPFMAFNDDTEVTHSEMLADGTVKVCIETPTDDGKFKNATCWLPMFKWEVNGYSYLEMLFLRQLVFRNESLILECSQDGGIDGEF